MKKSILTTVLLLAIAANAQVRNYNKTTAKSTKSNVISKESSSDSGSKFGIVAGVLFSDETGTDILTTSSRTGFYAGLSYKKNFSEALGLELDLVYATMGAEFHDEYDDKLDYLQLPITLNVKVFNVMIVQAGPQIGYLLSAKYDGEDYKDKLNALDYGLTVGLGVEFPGTNFGINGKFYYGLANINKDSSVDGEISNMSYSIGAFYNF